MRGGLQKRFSAGISGASPRSRSFLIRGHRGAAGDRRAARSGARKLPGRDRKRGSIVPVRTVKRKLMEQFAYCDQCTVYATAVPRRGVPNRHPASGLPEGRGSGQSTYALPAAMTSRAGAGTGSKGSFRGHERRQAAGIRASSANSRRGLQTIDTLLDRNV